MITGDLQKPSPSTSSEDREKKLERPLLKQANVGGSEDLNVFKVQSQSSDKDESNDVLNLLPTFGKSESHEKMVGRRGSDAIVSGKLATNGSSGGALVKRFSLQTSSLFDTSSNRPRSLILTKDDNDNNNNPANLSMSSKLHRPSSTIIVNDPRNNNSLPTVCKMNVESDNNNFTELPIENHLGEEICNDISSKKSEKQKGTVKFFNKQKSVNSYLEKQILVNDSTPKQMTKLRSNSVLTNCNSIPGSGR